MRKYQYIIIIEINSFVNFEIQYPVTKINNRHTLLVKQVI